MIKKSIISLLNKENQIKILKGGSTLMVTGIPLHESMITPKVPQEKLLASDQMC